MCQLLMNRRGARRLALSLALVLVDVLGLGGMVALLMTAMATPALAYVDPSVMTYTIQALAAVAVALSAVLGVAFRRTRKALMKLLHIDENASKTVEPDVHRIDPANKASVDRKAAAQIAAGKAGSASHFTEKDNRPKLRWRSRLGLALLACALLVFTLLIVAPLELVAANKQSLIFGLTQVWPVVVVAGVVIMLVLAFVLSAFRGRVFDVLLSLVAALAIACYVQALWLNSGLPVADGNLVDWTQYNKITLGSLLVWAAIFVAFIYLALSHEKIMRSVVVVASVALLIIQGVGVGSLFAEAASKPDTSVVMTEQGLFDVSDKKNVVVFVLDMTDTVQTEQAYAEHPEMLDGLTGFTWYQNATGTMIPTRYGIPSLLTGVSIQPDESFEDFHSTWYQQSSFLDDVKSQGYSVDIYSDSATWDDASNEYVNDHADNVMPLSEYFSGSINVSGTLSTLYNAAFYRDMPWIAKPFFWYYTDQINNGMVDQSAAPDDQAPLYSMNDPAYADQLEEQGLSVNEDQVGSFRFIHLLGTHWPYTMDENGDYVESGTDWETQMRGSFHIVTEYLDELKRLGVYDDTTVIITADHGIWTCPPGPITEPTTPIVFIKPAQSAELDSQPCAISQQPISQYDLHATILDAMGADQSVLDHYGEYNTPIQDRQDSIDRPRYYDATVSDGRQDTQLLQYEISGDVTNWDDWKLTGQEWDIPHEE